MRPPISYFGGKSRMADLIARLLPAHHTYLEPFCGSAAVLFAKQPAQFEIVNDIDGDLVTFFRVLRERPDELAAVCRLTPYARDEFRAALEPVADPLERARRFWVRSSQSYGSRISTNDSWSASRESNTSRPKSVRNRVARLQMWADRLALVAIENADALTVITRYGKAGVAIYCDPPYLWTARRDYHGSNGYRHEFGTEEDHRALAELLHAIPSTVIVSGYAHPLYDELYDGWDRLEVPLANSVQLRRLGERRTRTIEVLWSNRPLHRQQQLTEISANDQEATRHG